MKKRLFFILFTVFLTKGLSAQVDAVSIDSIKTLLCHNWGYRTMIMAGQELTMNESITYQFFDDLTMQRVVEAGTQTGTWSYDPTTGLILIKINTTTLYVQKLVTGDLVISVGDGSGSTSNQLGIATAFNILE